MNGRSREAIKNREQRDAFVPEPLPERALCQYLYKRIVDDWCRAGVDGGDSGKEALTRGRSFLCSTATVRVLPRGFFEIRSGTAHVTGT